MNDKKHNPGKNRKRDNKPGLSSSTAQQAKGDNDKAGKAGAAAGTTTRTSAPGSEPAESSGSRQTAGASSGNSGGSGWLAPVALLFGLFGTGFSGYLYTKLQNVTATTNSKMESQAESVKTDISSVQTSLDQKTEALSASLDEKTTGLNSLLEEKTAGLNSLLDEKTGALSQRLDESTASIQNEVTANKQELATTTASAVQELTSRTEHELNTVTTSLNTGISLLRENTDERFAAFDQRVSQLDESVQQTHELASRGQRDWVLAEVDYLLRTGVHRVKLAGDVKAGVIALESASTRLHSLGDINYLPVREQIAEEVAALRQVGAPDIEGLIFKLQHMSKRADKLPLPGDPSRNQSITEQITEDPAEAGLAIGRRLLDRFKPSFEAIPVDQSAPPGQETAGDGGRRAPKPTKEQLTASESLRLHLQAARLSALRHDQESFRSHLDNAISYSEGMFDIETEQVRTFLADLQQIRDTSIVPRVPTLGSSLALFNKVNAKQGEN